LDRREGGESRTSAQRKSIEQEEKISYELKEGQSEKKKKRKQVVEAETKRNTESFSIRTQVRREQPGLPPNIVKSFVKHHTIEPAL